MANTSPGLDDPETSSRIVLFTGPELADDFLEEFAGPAIEPFSRPDVASLTWTVFTSRLHLT